MESAPNYPLLSDKAFLARFDILATLVPPGEDKEKAATSLGFTPRRIWYPYFRVFFLTKKKTNLLKMLYERIVIYDSDRSKINK